MTSESEKVKNNKNKGIVLRLIKVLLVLLFGVLIGFGAGYVLWHDKAVKQESQFKNSNSSSQLSRDLFSNRSLPSRDQTKRAIQSVQTDLKDGKLTQEQADRITQKLDEITDALQGYDSRIGQGRIELQKQQEQFQRWLQENNLPLTYSRLLQ